MEAIFWYDLEATASLRREKSIGTTPRASFSDVHSLLPPGAYYYYYCGFRLGALLGPLGWIQPHPISPIVILHLSFKVILFGK